MKSQKVTIKNKKNRATPNQLKRLATLSSPSKYFRVYTGSWIIIAGLILAILGFWLIIFKPATKPTLTNQPEQFSATTALLRESMSQNSNKSPLENYSYSFSRSTQYPNCQLTIQKRDSKYAIFSVGCENGDGNQYLALNTLQGWTVVTGMGQERPYCNDLKAYQIPPEWYESCITTGKDGSTITLPGKLVLP